MKKSEIEEFILELSKCYDGEKGSLDFTSPFELLVAVMLSAYSQAKVMCAPKAKNITIYKKAAHLGTRTEEPIVVASIYETILC